VTAGTVILWRHGQTDYNLEGRVQGGVDIPLNATGMVQAAAGAAALVRYLGATDRTAIVSSPLARARATAEALAALIGVGVALDARLREREFGAWEGLTRDEMTARWPDEFRLWRTGATPAGIGMETKTQVADRVHAAVLEHAGGRQPAETLVVVSHGSATTQVLARLLGAEPGHFPVRGLDNAHWSTVNHRPDLAPPWRLRAHNIGPG